ncbi:MAG: hypothetical protein K9K82_13230 [Desulfobacteraceae bacterium]|nr:hypothetical protein [Desulfobacteraceae bacterium]
MEDVVVKIINYIYMLGALAFVLEYVVSHEKGEALALRLIDWSNSLSSKNVDKLVSRVSLSFSEKYDRIYGKKYFGKREWLASAAIAFTYCQLFYLAEKAIGFDTNLAKQLEFWFLPNLVADMLSLNFTRWLLRRLQTHPEKYLQYLFYDLLMVLFCFYLCFSFTIIYLTIFSEYSLTRILLHPLFLFQTVIQDFPAPTALDSLFIIIIAATGFIPTVLHFIFVAVALTAKFLTPLLGVFVNNLIEKMISFERHPMGVAVIAGGLFLLPFVIIFDLLIP